MSTLPERLARAITLAGPMPVSQFMAAANAEYYAQCASIGAEGDFVTAPEVSQMFGELIGIALADSWERAGRPDVHFVELGPGQGTLAADALRAMATAGLNPDVHFVETSARLRGEQAKCVPDAKWHDDPGTLPDDRPLLIVANEFFDALPVEQMVKSEAGWHRRLVACQDVLFLPVTGPRMPDDVIPEDLRDAGVGSIIESSPAGVQMVRAIADRLARQSGTAIIVDYGYEGPAAGETIQAVRQHGFANPFDAPGSVDISAHVDFATLAAAAALHGADVHGPVTQRDFLESLGIVGRTAALARRSPERSGELVAAHHRLTSEKEMGTLFRVLGLTGKGWPVPGGSA